MSLVYIQHLTYLHFYLMRTFKIYCLSSSQIYKAILLTIVIMLYIIFPELIYLITGSLYFLTSKRSASPISPNSHLSPLATANLFFVLISLSLKDQPGVANGSILFVLWLDNITLYVCMCVCIIFS